MTSRIDSPASSQSTSSQVLLADGFPSKAFLLTQHCDSEAPAVARWSQDGQRMIILDPVTFASTQLPLYFKHKNLQSFVRQLNAYGFRKCTDKGKKNDGSISFQHPYFQRGHPDMLENISRSKKANLQEEKKEEHSFGMDTNARFDQMQQQMDMLSRKLDLLISLVASTKQQEDYSLIDTTVVGKRRRVHSASPISDITDPPAMAPKTAVAATPIGDELEIVMEDDEQRWEQHEYDESIEAEPDEPLPLHSSILDRNCSNGDKEEVDDDDFKMFVDTMLDNENHKESNALQHEHQDETDTSVGSLQESMPNALFSDRLRSKSNPHAVEGEMQVPQTTASAIVVSDHEDYDEEAGEYISDPPLTTAVEVTDATTVELKLSRRTKRFIGVIIIFVLIAFIVWPCVVFLGGKRNKRPPPPPSQRPPHAFDADRFNETIRDHLNETIGEKIRDNILGDGNETDQSRLPPRMRAADDPLRIAFEGDSYECIVVIKSP